MSTNTISQRTLPFILLLPSLLVILAITLEYSGLDLWWISLFYDAQKHLWPYRQNWLFDNVLHSGGQLLDKAFAVVSLITLVVLSLKKSLARYRKIFAYFLLASVAGPALVGIAKNITHIYSPWNLQLYNGAYPYIRIFDPVPPGSPVGHAFPAGHASGGYCLLSLYFVFLRYRSSYRYYGLIFALGLGFIFGVAQQVRGAHFPSHDLITVFTCWYVSLTFYFLFYPEEWHKLSRH